MLSGLTNLRNELMEAVTDTTVAKERRRIALDMIEEIDRSQVAGSEPSTKPQDGWLDVLPLQIQMEMWLLITLGSKWAKDKPLHTYERAVLTSPVMLDTAPEFENIF